MTILLDVNLSPDWIEFLAVYGFTAVHWSSIGECDAPDTAIMAYAVESNSLVLTQDLDYGTILAATSAERPTVVQIRAGRVTPTTLGLQVVTALGEITEGPMQGALITIERKRTRVTILPLRKQR